MAGDNCRKCRMKIQPLARGEKSYGWLAGGPGFELILTVSWTHGFDGVTPADRKESASRSGTGSAQKVYARLPVGTGLPPFNA
jgi:hypothetical protein